MEAPTSTRRWFHLTPDRLIVALLALEGFLFLSERFHWFAFNDRKGWTVLIGLATVGIAGILMMLWFAASLFFRRRFQFSIRSLLVMVVVVAIPCSWLAVEVKKAEQQRRAVEAIQNLHGFVAYDYQVDESRDLIVPGKRPLRPEWLGKLLGDDFFASVSVVIFSTSTIKVNANVTDAELQHLKGFTALTVLSLFNTKITDAGLECLKDLPHLQSLDLWGTTVTDAGLVYLKNLSHLKHLNLMDNRITDAGFERLKDLSQLQELYLGGSKITDAGLGHLQGLTHLTQLMLRDTQITDVGLQTLGSLTQLKVLYLTDAHITDAGLTQFKGLSHLQYLDLTGTQITNAGLQNLESLTALSKLDLGQTKVTRA